jgi:pimeloyl-ACP methyl ester carboxylesterase
MYQFNRSLGWVTGYLQRGEGVVPGTQTALYSLRDLVNKGLIAASEGRGLLIEAGLVDLVWEMTWSDDAPTPDEELDFRLAEVDGYAVFMHGWTGNHSIWESIPGLVATSSSRLIALSVDHNGFGLSRFVKNAPSLEECCPPAAMLAVERLVNLLKLRRQPGDPKPRVINFVGHSMGGAALFYLNPIFWRSGEETRYAIAPALLLEDEIARAFFTALGIGIGIVNRIRAFEIVERYIKPNMVEAIAAGASQFVRDQHFRQYEETPRGITAATFTAMGMLKNREIAHKWETFRVILGHRDALVGLVPMLDLLSSLEVPAANVRVVAGSHYLFSVGHEAVFQHAQNRELVVQDLLALHALALDLQKRGVIVG